MSGYWNEPGTWYMDRAMEETGVAEYSLEELAGEHVRSIPVGVYPIWDKVYEQAWRLRFGEEGRSDKGVTPTHP
jgi:hypothetical protein